MSLAGFKSQKACQGVYQRGATKWQGERPPDPISPETWANNIVKLNVRDLEGVFKGAIRALAPAGCFGKQVTRMVDATDLEMTARYAGWGPATRQYNVMGKHGRVQAIEVTV